MNVEKALTSVFYGSNIFFLLFNLILWIVYSNSRIVTLYGLFDMVLPARFYRSQLDLVGGALTA